MLKEQSPVFKKRPASIAFACAAEAFRRVLHITPFPVQYAAAYALCRGEIIQMNTGEGKTLTAVLAASLRALDGHGVHVITVNEYLSRRDYEMNKAIYEMLGFSVGLCLSGMSTEEKQLAYQSDVTYTTATEAGFDYLRDGVAIRPERIAHRELYYAIVDEADSILLDEAVTPMLLSGSRDGDIRDIKVADQLARYLKPTVFATLENEEDFDLDACPGDYVVDEKQKTATLTGQGIKKAEQYYRLTNLFEPENMMVYHRLLQAISAYGTLKKDIDYIIRNDKIALVDRNTGRVMDGRRYCAGLHQALEAKEKLEIDPESATIASITYQKFFSLYKGISGMTGTAWTARQELDRTYHVNVRKIPPNLPCIRIDRKEQIFKTKDEKLNAVCNAAAEAHSVLRPVLIGTPNDECSEKVSSMLSDRGIEHIVLNAKQDADEAEAIAKAGLPGSVIVSTNIAGRGTDIRLGGDNPVLAEQVQSLGGLLVLGTERQRSRRTDDQLAGRAGRQGDPGESRFFVSEEDDLYRYFGEHALTSRELRRTQKISEGLEAGQRYTALEMDEVLQQHRQNFLIDRKALITALNLDEVFEKIIRNTVSLLIERYPDPQNQYLQLKAAYFRIFGCKIMIPKDQQSIDEDEAIQSALAVFQRKKSEIPDQLYMELAKSVMLQCMDEGWSNFLESFESIKQGYQMMTLGRNDRKNVLFENTQPILLETRAWIMMEGLRRLFRCKLSIQKTETT